MSERIKAYGKVGFIAILVVLIDQTAKLLVRTNLAITETWMPVDWLKPFLRIIHWKNTGVAFGLFQGSGWIFTIIGLVLILLVILFYRQVWQGPAFWQIALGLELGGALGNFLDRINPQVGYVVDFIWVGNFPVFNLADAAIVIGAVVLIIGIWSDDHNEKEPEPVMASCDMTSALPENNTDEPVTSTSDLPAEPVAEFRLPKLPTIEDDRIQSHEQ